MKMIQCVKINVHQIKSLLWKDILIRKKQPWITLLQFLWPCIIFFAIYTIRFRFDAVYVNECQYQTRQLPSQETVLPFFQSYMCTLDNTCMNTKDYEEITTFSKAPVTPVLNIVQTFLNDEKLFNTFLELPERMHFVEALTTIITSKHFPFIQENINQVTNNLQLYDRKTDSGVNMTNLWSDDQTFSHYFYDLCGKQSVVTKNVRFIDRTFYEKDYNGPDKDELDVMPTHYCKQLYLDITNTNDGKMTWNQVKPVIQGKILYGPATDEINEIIALANGTFEGINRLKMFINSLDQTITRLRTDAQIKRRYGNIINIATSPVIRTIISSTLIDVEVVESILNSLMNSDTVATVFKTIGNILECFSVDRFVPIQSERELETVAFEMNKKKLFLGGIFFNVSTTNSSAIARDFSYKIRMDIDNTPITIENRNRFWFPGPMSSFAMDMRYHRGFIQLQHSVDQAIVRVAKRKQFEMAEDSSPRDSQENTVKRSPQFGDFFDFFLGTSTSAESQPVLKYNVDDYKYFTKEFPYPKYKKDTYKTGLYLYQAVQMAFFLALIIQVGSAVRCRIWLRESGNYTLMRIMGLRKSAEFLSWFATTLLEIFLTFFLCTVILYSGGILETTCKFFLLCFLLIFGVAVIAFCFLIATLFTSASIGSVSAVIIFLITFTPYIIIVSLDTKLSFAMKILPNLSFSTAFCYAFQTIMRYELQQKPLSLAALFKGSMCDNELQFAVIMILIDTVIYFLLGSLMQRFYRTELSFHRVPTMKMHETIGASIDDVSVVYNYGNAPALRAVSLNFRRNCITCLLGRNGAGKSTIIRLLTGQVSPTSGKVYWSQDHENPDKIGLCPQHSVVIPNLTAREHLELYASIKFTTNPKEEIETMMENLRLGKYEHYQVENLSGGYKRLLNVAIAFLGAPNLVILDEPCSGIDIEARKIIWQLIEILRKDRAVILATHYLDEAENLCDNIVIFRNGKIVSESSSKTLQKQFTKSFDLKIQLVKDGNDCETIEEIKEHLGPFRPNTINIRKHLIHVNISYLNRSNMFANFEPLIKSLELLQLSKKIENFKICSKNLEEIFNELNSRVDDGELLLNGNGPSSPVINVLQPDRPDVTRCMAARTLFWKRFMHFKRNYKLMVCILVLPVLFEIAAMGLMTLRVPDEFDKDLRFDKDLYPNSATFFSSESDEMFDRSVFDHLECDTNCESFNSSEGAFRWILNTHEEHINRRFGGVSSNDSKFLIWYNNKGYHSMPVWLNQLSTALLRAEMNDSTYNITTINHPLKLGRKELSMSSILQQSGDAGISVILMIAFSYVIAGLSVYMVNERINGEKLQQKLCGISFPVYWGVSFVWDMMIYCTALVAAIAVIKIYDIPVYTAKENLFGICCLLFMFGFATIPMEHLFGKLYNDASQAAMNILCMNIVIGVTTILITTLIDILGESDQSETIRMILNRLFLIFPQHALADGLVVLCRNHITSEVMERFYIDTYKSPIRSDLLLPHYLSLFVLGLIFVTLNYIVEMRIIQHWIAKVVCQTKSACIELQAVQINSNGTSSKYREYTPMHVLSVQNLSKSYKGGKQVLQNVSFYITKGECYGLLGTNGAGKSTIFSILSGEILQTSGCVDYVGTNGISYCPQTNALDSLLTVTEVIHFYGTLRNVTDLKQLTIDTLRSYDLEKYAKILVKNLSGGNRRKLNVAVTCFGSTDLILMDEPTCDMDPVTRSLVYTAIRSLIRQQRSVILTSHTITEIDRVCQRICVLRDGKIIAQGSPTVLQEMYGNRYAITIFCNKIQSKRIEIDLRHDISTLDHLIAHNHCLQFTVQIHFADSNDLHLSDLFYKLYKIVSKHDVKYTITECLLDQALEHMFSSKNQTDTE